MAGSKTRRQSRGKSLSIPQLRKSFHAVESFLSTKLRNGSNKTEDVVKSFRKEWQRHFRKNLSVNAARSYINHMRDKLSQRGGSSNQLSGAALDMTTRPGVYGPYGNFLDYVNKGFQVGVPEPGIQQECGVKDFTPNISSTISQRAGARKTRKNRKQRGGLNPLTGAPFAAEFRPFVAQNPVSIQASIQNNFKALPSPPSGDPSDIAFSYKMPPYIGKIPGADIAGLDRDLLKDVSVPY
jgi:hypothetical protein